MVARPRAAPRRPAGAPALLGAQGLPTGRIGRLLCGRHAGTMSCPMGQAPRLCFRRATAGRPARRPPSEDSVSPCTSREKKTQRPRQTLRPARALQQGVATRGAASGRGESRAAPARAGAAQPAPPLRSPSPRLALPSPSRWRIAVVHGYSTDSRCSSAGTFHRARRRGTAQCNQLLPSQGSTRSRARDAG